MKQIFDSERISFVEVSELLIEDYLVMINDMENVQRFINPARISDEPYTRDQEINWVNEKLANKDQVFSMIEKKSGDFIGNIEFMDVHDDSGELGIALTALKQNSGFGTEAILAMIDYGKNHLGLKKIHLRTNPNNARAIHVYEKCGFREYDRNKDHVYMKLDNCLPHKEFGEKEDVIYLDRKGAYLILVCDGRIGAVRTWKGLFLPGGGIEEGESDLQCIERECLEEMGCSVIVKKKICTAETYGINERIGYFHPIQTYYLGELKGKVSEPTEEGNEPEWF